MITKRTLEKWRREAFQRKIELAKIGEDDKESMLYIDQERILRLTQELIDQHLMRPK